MSAAEIAATSGPAVSSGLAALPGPAALAGPAALLGPARALPAAAPALAVASFLAAADSPVPEDSGFLELCGSSLEAPARLFGLNCAPLWFRSAVGGHGLACRGLAGSGGGRNLVLSRISVTRRP